MGDRLSMTVAELIPNQVFTLDRAHYRIPNSSTEAGGMGEGNGGSHDAKT
jgi:hypothetical protein